MNAQDEKKFFELTYYLTEIFNKMEFKDKCTYINLIIFTLYYKFSDDQRISFINSFDNIVNMIGSERFEDKRDFTSFLHEANKLK